MGKSHFYDLRDADSACSSISRERKVEVGPETIAISIARYRDFVGVEGEVLLHAVSRS